MSTDDKALSEQMEQLFQKSSFLKSLLAASTGLASTLIISVGSGGGEKNDHQKCPKFATELAKSASENLVKIFNIDPLFHSSADTDHGFVERLSKDKLEVYAYDVQFTHEGLFGKCISKVLVL